MIGVQIDERGGTSGAEWVELLAAAYLDNPLHLAAFPGAAHDRMEGNRKLFRVALGGMLSGTWWVASEGDGVVGLAHVAPSPACVVPPAVAATLPSVMAEAMGPAGARVAEWFMAWAGLHPRDAHWHLGPFAVAPSRQGRGIGSRLLEACCRRMDAAGVVGYLETDAAKNVELYQRFGFRVAREADVLGVRNWFMLRAPERAG